MKSHLRKEMKRVLNLISEEQHEAHSTSIANALYETCLWKEARVIAATVSRNKEVNTKAIIERAWRDGKKVAVPKCNPTTSQMVFYEITNFSQLETVYYGLAEPIVEETVPVSKSSIDLLLVPGVVYSKNGYRIGYGGGYYDRYLTDYTGQKLSLAFDCQVVSEVPYESHDIPVEYILTEKELICCESV
jgi:5-formyltetrahydrofolate cyclo-ligase